MKNKSSRIDVIDSDLVGNVSLQPRLGDCENVNVLVINEVFDNK